MPASEIEIQRSLTHAFIMTRPITVTLIPRNRRQQPAGGFIWENAVPRAPQVMRLVPPTGTVREEMPQPINTQDGIERRVEFMLLGEWDALIGQFDIFTHDDHQWEVVQLAVDNGWEKRAAVARYG